MVAGPLAVRRMSVPLPLLCIRMAYGLDALLSGFLSFLFFLLGFELMRELERAAITLNFLKFG